LVFLTEDCSKGIMAKGNRSYTRGLFIVTASAVLLVLALQVFRVGPAPEIEITSAAPAIGRSTGISVKASEPARGLSHIKVEFMQQDKTELIAERHYPHRSALSFWGARTQNDLIDVAVGRDTLKGLKQANAIIRVTAARAGTWFRTPGPVVKQLILPVYLSPPTLMIASTKTYAAQGGCELVVYRVGDTCVRDGVMAGDWWFPGHPLPGGGAADRFAFFAVPYTMEEHDVRLVAEDAAANRAEAAVIDRFFPKPIRQDSIQLSDSFFAKVIPEILSQSPEAEDRGDPLQTYLGINGDLRVQGNAALMQLSEDSKPQFFWNKPFLMLPNGKVTAAFAERRTYRYQGRVVDQQDHLGYDLASTRHASIPAANGGIVMLAKYFGIYGNAVAIDHGYGLMSLYGHLSSIAVSEGQQVERGDVIGQTGESGLAGGDHLHFSMLLYGRPVNPVEWWDGHWIQDRIARKLGSAWQFER
jgi:murein DD-endopeptidase MepM/ murein hydrolase activator NlpD